MPARVQRKRTAGWTTPLDAEGRKPVYVGRGSTYGNSWRIGSTAWTVLPGGWIDRRPHEPLTAEQAVESFVNANTHDIEFLRQIREELAGRDLMCWCRVGSPCHGDWQLLVANSPLPLESFVDRSPRPAGLPSAERPLSPFVASDQPTATPKESR